MIKPKYNRAFQQHQLDYTSNSQATPYRHNRQQVHPDNSIGLRTRSSTSSRTSPSLVQNCTFALLQSRGAIACKPQSRMRVKRLHCCKNSEGAAGCRYHIERAFPARAHAYIVEIGGTVRICLTPFAAQASTCKVHFCSVVEGDLLVVENDILMYIQQQIVKILEFALPVVQTSEAIAEGYYRCHIVGADFLDCGFCPGEYGIEQRSALVSTVVPPVLTAWSTMQIEIDAETVFASPFDCSEKVVIAQYEKVGEKRGCDDRFNAKPASNVDTSDWHLTVSLSPIMESPPTVAAVNVTLKSVVSYQVNGSRIFLFAGELEEVDVVLAAPVVEDLFLLDKTTATGITIANMTMMIMPMMPAEPLVKGVHALLSKTCQFFSVSASALDPRQTQHCQHHLSCGLFDQPERPSHHKAQLRAQALSLLLLSLLSLLSLRSLLSASSSTLLYFVAPLIPPLLFQAMSSPTFNAFKCSKAPTLNALLVLLLPSVLSSSA
ncbi:glycoside hydrolase, partial [Aureobasidium melanogenum]